MQAIDYADSLQPYLMKLAEHFAALRDFKKAEKIYKTGRMYKDAIEMYNSAGTLHEHSLVHNQIGFSLVSTMQWMTLISLYIKEPD